VSHDDLVTAIVTPYPGDADIALALLDENDLPAQSFGTVSALANALSPRFGCAILVEEALTVQEFPVLREALQSMPEWCDLPLIIVSNDVTARVTSMTNAFPDSGNITFLEQPLNPHSLLSAVSVALRAASRQREVAELIAERERAIKLRDEFLAMLAHELRNPLAPMRNVLYLLKQNGSRDPSVTRSTEILERQVNHVVRLVDDLMDVARLERGKVTLKTARIDLNRVVASAVETCLQAAQERGHHLAIELGVDALIVNADEVRLAQIVTNLIGNAIKFSTSPGEIRVTTTSAQDGFAVLSVEDHGIGFDPSVADELFNPFVQASATMERSAGGLGMGLTIVKRLVELHRGSVSANSEGLGKGSRFVVSIPLDRTALPRGTEPAPPCIEAHRRRVVVVEDNADIRETLRMLLTSWGHDVAVAEDGPSGVDRVLHEQPDVALVDIGLPLMNGYEVARAIRRVIPNGSIRLIAVTGYGQPIDKELAAQAGFDMHLLKPIQPEFLERLLSE
jgi:two-component system, sensor histidine kinase